jgi:ABC-type uncharacterized transport system permease subunit
MNQVTDGSMVGWILHGVVFVTFLLYFLALISLGIGLSYRGIGYQRARLVVMIDYAAQMFLAFLVILTFVIPSGRGAVFLWIAIAIELVAFGIGWHQVVIRFLLTGAVSILLLIASFLAHFSDAVDTTWSEMNFLFMLAHILPAIIAEGLLLLTACSAMVYLLHSYLLKRRNVNVLSSKLPSLSRLDFWMAGFTRVGFFLMSVSILVGYLQFYFASDGELNFFELSWNALHALIGWLLLLIMLVSQTVLKCSVRGRAVLALLTVPLFLSTMFGVRWLGLEHYFDSDGVDTVKKVSEF